MRRLSVTPGRAAPGQTLVGRFAACCALALLAGLFLYPVAIPLVAHWRDPSQALADYTLNLDRSRDIVRLRAYPPQFTYPLPGVLARAALGGLGETASAAIWATLLVASGAFSAGFLARRLDPDNPTRGLVAVAFGFFACKYYVEWDLRALNCNLLYLALVLGALWALDRRAAVSGSLLAASVGLKLYSAAFVPWLHWRRQWRAFGWTMAGLAVFFVLLPALVLGPGTALDLNRQWFAEVVGTADLHFSLTFPAYVVSPTKLVHYLFGAGVVPGSPAWLRLEPRTVDAMAQGIKVAWLAGVAAYFLIRRKRRAMTDGDFALADASILLLAPLPISPLLQPHQCVVLVVPSALFARHVLCSDRGASERLFLAGILLVGLLAHEVGPGGPLRGLGVALHFLLTLWGLCFLAGRADSAGAVARPATESARHAA